MPESVLPLLFGAIPLVIGLAFAYMGTKLAVTTWRTHRQDGSWPRTTAQVVSAAQERRVRTNSDGPDSTYYVLVAHYRYRHPTTGAMLEGTADAPRDRAIAVDQPVEIVYDPEDPARSRLPGAQDLPGHLGVGCAVLLGGFFALIGFVIVGVIAYLALQWGGQS